MRFIMMGTGPFAVPTLQALAATDHSLLLVVSRPPAKAGSPASPLQRAGAQLPHPPEIWTPASINHPDSQARLASLAPDLLIVCDYGEILRPEILATARLGGINLHGSLLPKYRGAAPVQWALLRGEEETGNSVIQMTPGLDAGPCLGQQHVSIDPDENAEQLEARLALLGAKLVCEIVDQLAMGKAAPIEQQAGDSTKAPRLKKADGAIDWSQSALQIKNQVRALQPWPRTYTFWHRASGPPLRLNIDRVSVVPITTDDAPGTLLETADRLLVATGDGALELHELQPAGKRAMAAKDFLRGNRMTIGERLGFE